MEFQDGGHLVLQNVTNFGSNLAEVVLYHPIKFQKIAEESSSWSPEMEFKMVVMVAIMFFEVGPDFECHLA